MSDIIDTAKLAYDKFGSESWHLNLRSYKKDEKKEDLRPEFDLKSSHCGSGLK